MYTIDDLLNSESESWDQILRCDSERFRRELAAVAVDKNRSWFHRTKAMRIIGTHADLLCAVGATQVITALLAMFDDEFPPEKLRTLADRIVSDDQKCGRDGISLLILATLFEKLAPETAADQIISIESALKGCFLDESLASVLLTIRSRRLKNDSE